MAYYITEKQPMRMVGVRIPLAEDMEENQRMIPGFWKCVSDSGLFDQISALSDRDPGGILGVSVYEGPQQFFYYIGASTDTAVPEGMYAVEIPSAT